MSTNTLAHYGILGMKWGRRKSDPGSGLNGGKKHTKESSIKNLSDDELRKRISRIEMERRYTQLTAKEKTAGEKFVNAVLGDAAKQTATKYAAQFMSKGMDAMMNSATKKKK